MTAVDTSPVTSPKRAAILDAALDSFLELGFANTSMDAVAARASVSKATIYAHFSGKLDLFAAVIGQGCDSHFAEADYWPAPGTDARAALTHMAESLLSFMLEPRTVELLRILVAEGPRHPDLVQVFWQAGPARSTPRLSAVFQELEHRGHLKVPDPMAAAILFVGMMRSEVFFCRLLGLPPGTERINQQTTIAAAVDVLLKAYAV